MIAAGAAIQMIRPAHQRSAVRCSRKVVGPSRTTLFEGSVDPRSLSGWRNHTFREPIDASPKSWSQLDQSNCVRPSSWTA
jgi:hypothetical protein